MAKWNYGVILDAGSSGTRVYVYRWKKPAKALKDASDKQLHRLPEVKTEKGWTLKTHPGVSTFGEKPESVGVDHLKPLFDHALSVIPKSEVKHTPIFLLATAGVRLLPQYQRDTLLKEICSYARETTRFQLPDCDLHIQVIPGDTEGLYGWIAANYLLEGFDKPDEHNHGKAHHTYGFLDMGGASAQIAFAPNSTEAEKHANDLKLLRLRTLDGKPQEHRVFTTTWLGFGANESRRRYVKALKAETDSNVMELPDPCLPKGLKMTDEDKPIEPGSDAATGKAPHLIGTGNFQECLLRTKPLLAKDAACSDDPCLLNGVHVPSIDFEVNHFVGVSEYWHTIHQIFELAHKHKSYDFQTFQERVSEFCGRHWDDIQEDVAAHKWGKKVDVTTALQVCFKASWVISVLHDGVGVPRVGLEDMGGDHNVTKDVIHKAKDKGFLEPFQAVNDIDGVEVSWTLGKMVLYASSQVPPAESSLAVGFGANVAGIPLDFQHAGGTPDELSYENDDDDDWLDNLFTDSPRRIPGLLIFLLIVALAAYLLCGRDRRAILTSKLRRMASGSPGPSPGSGRRRSRLPFGIAGKFFSSTPSGPAYDRLESGDMDEHDFELPEVGSLAASDSDTAGSPRGRSSGWATPQLVTQSQSQSSHLDAARPLPFNKLDFAQPPPSRFDSAPAESPYGVTSQPVMGVGGPGSFAVGTAIDRAGLMSRTDSKDRLSPPSVSGSPRRQSRTLSPSAGKGLAIAGAGHLAGWAREKTSVD